MDCNSFTMCLERVIENMFSVRTEVFTAATMKNSAFWDVEPCRSCVNGRFGETYRLHLQGTKIRERGTSVSRWLQTDSFQKDPSSCLRLTSVNIKIAVFGVLPRGLVNRYQLWRNLLPPCSGKVKATGCPENFFLV
jgi:hypothetical protein